MSRREAEEHRSRGYRLLKKNFLARLVVSIDYDEAAQAFKAAALSYKLAQDWACATECWLLAAECCEKEHNLWDQANFLVEAGLAEMKLSSESVSRHLALGCRLHATNDKASVAGKVYSAVAEEFANAGREELALQCFEEARKFYSVAPFSKVSERGVAQSCALLLAKLRQYGKALAQFEALARSCGDSSYEAKNYLFKASLVRLAHQDLASVERALESYCELAPDFAGSREGKLVRDLVEAGKKGDGDAVLEVFSQFAQLTPLDKWQKHFEVLIVSNFAGRSGTASNRASGGDAHSVGGAGSGGALHDEDRSKELAARLDAEYDLL